MAKPVWGKSVHFDWFLLCRDFAVRTVSMDTVEAVYFYFEAKPASSKFATKTAKKMWILLFFISKLPELKLKRFKFYRDFKDGWRRRTFSEQVQYYPEGMETFDAETATGITKARRLLTILSPNRKVQTRTQEKRRRIRASNGFQFSAQYTAILKSQFL